MLAILENLRARPDRASALKRYRSVHGGYEGSTQRIREFRRLAIFALGLRRGDTVFDVACGVGETLPLLARAVGSSGRVVGIEQSPDMAQLARQRCVQQGLRNVVVLESPVEQARIPYEADAVLLCYTHDVLQLPEALGHLFAHARPGARVAVTGACWGRWWQLPASVVLAWRTRQYLTTYRGLQDPCEYLRGYCPDLVTLTRFHLGTGYVAAGSYAHQGMAQSTTR